MKFMEKESVKKFDLEAAFKALDEIEIPVAEKGIAANRVDLRERFNTKSHTEILVEDYYDVSSSEDLEEAKEERDGEVAQAKLARIEKIVDLDAETADDLLPSYVGKVIIQCPQCMTLFYKNPEDIEKSEENPDVVNINEICQHCGNSSGYNLIGKVDSVGNDEADKYEEAPAEENELDLDFEEPTEEVDAEGTGDGAKVDEDDLDLDLDLSEVPEEIPEETPEEKNESLNHSEAERDAEEDSELFTAHKSENLTLNEKADTKAYSVFYKDKCGHQLFTGTKEECDTYVKEHSDDNMVVTHGGLEVVNLDDAGVDAPALPESLNNSEAQKDAEEGSELKTENESENLTLNEEVDKDLDKKLKAHNDYIAYLQQMIKQEEEALKKTDNEEVKAAIQRRLDAFNADLEEALPDAIKPVPEVAEAGLADTEPAEEIPAEEPTEVQAEEEPKEDEAPVEEALTEETGECKVVLSDKPEKEVFTGTKEECEQIVEKNKETNTAKEHGLEIIEPAIDESLNASDAQKEAAEGSELKTENGSENLTLNEDVNAEIDSIIASWDVNENLNEEGNLDKLLDSDEFKTPVSEEEINAAREDAKEESLEECDKQKLTEEPDPEVSAIIDSWEEAPVEEGYTGNPAERTTHLEYEDKDPTDGKAVLPDNIEKQLTEGEECKDGECDKPLEECGENCEKSLKEEDEVPAEEETLVDEPVEKPVEGEEAVEEEPKEEVEEKTPLDVIKNKVDIHGEEDTLVIAEKGQLDNPDAPKIEVEATEEEKEILEPEFHEETSEETPVEEVPTEIEEPEFNEDDIDELDECSLNKHIDEYLHEVYSNVKSYETTGCELKEGKLVVEGKISFNSGKEKLTMFEFLPAYGEGKLFFEGYNKDFSDEKAFTLNCSINESKTLITESFGYKYKINENLVEGLK